MAIQTGQEIEHLNSKMQYVRVRALHEPSFEVWPRPPRCPPDPAWARSSEGLFLRGIALLGLEWVLLAEAPLT